MTCSVLLIQMWITLNSIFSRGVSLGINYRFLPVFKTLPCYEYFLVTLFSHLLLERSAQIILTVVCRLNCCQDGKDGNGIETSILLPPPPPPHPPLLLFTHPAKIHLMYSSWFSRRILFTGKGSNDFGTEFGIHVRE